MRRASAASLVVVADQVQRAVHHQMRPVRAQRSCACCARLRAQHARRRSPGRRAARPVRCRARPAAGKRQHVGGAVAAAVARVQPAALGRARRRRTASSRPRPAGPAQRSPSSVSSRRVGAQPRTRAALQAASRAVRVLRRPTRRAPHCESPARLVGLHDALHQRMAHDIAAASKKVKATPSTPRSTSIAWLQARLLAGRQVGLRDIAGDHRLRAEADARQEHLHLLDGGVLRLVENDEGVVSERPRMKASGATSITLRSMKRATRSKPIIS